MINDPNAMLKQMEIEDMTSDKKLNKLKIILASLILKK